MAAATFLLPVEESNITPRIFAGPALGLEVSCKVSGEEAGFSVEGDCEDFGAETKSIDFGVFFGAGIDIAVGNGDITLDALYNLGLTNINDVAGDPFDVTNRNIQVRAGYAFRVGG